MNSPGAQRRRVAPDCAPGRLPDSCWSTHERRPDRSQQVRTPVPATPAGTPAATVVGRKCRPTVLHNSTLCPIRLIPIECGFRQKKLRGRGGKQSGHPSSDWRYVSSPLAVDPHGARDPELFAARCNRRGTPGHSDSCKFERWSRHLARRCRRRCSSIQTATIEASSRC